MSEELARKFHETYERLAPSFGYETRKETKDFVPTSANGMLMLAVCSEVLGGLSSENERLRGLLKESLVFVLYAEHWTHTVNRLSAEIQKEVGDE